MKHKWISLFVLLAFFLGTVSCDRSIPLFPTRVAKTKAPVSTPVPDYILTTTALVKSAFITATAIGAMKSPTPISTQAPNQPEPGAPASPTLTSPARNAPAPVVAPKKYFLHKGEFPFCIARRFNVDVHELMVINHLNYRQIFYPGQVLRIPETGHPFPWRRVLRPHPTMIIVQPGDTIYAIACYFGDLDPFALAQANGLSRPYRLTPGQVLTVP